tara:strand:- start:333 stop:1040 length:708 start_codon:yes stop_codon:yes gene_type:complete
MSHLILVRHGQSIWNLENRFTGWVDVELSSNGEKEAIKAGNLIKTLDIKIERVFTSYLKRAINTLEFIMKINNFKNLPVVKAWELNERHYGALTGLNKDEMQKKLSKEKVHELRRSWDCPPEKLDKNSPYHPNNINIYKEIQRDKIPDTESLKDTYERVIPYYENNIKNLKQNVLISAHGNSIRALCKYLFNLDNKNISNLEIPTGNPLVITINNQKVVNAEYLDKDRAKDLIVF